MPFSRPKNLPILYQYLKGQVDTWWPLTDQETGFPNEPWIKKFEAPLPRRENVCFWNIDNWIEWALVQEPDLLTADNYFQFMSDDCLWELTYWHKLRRAIDQDPAPDGVVSSLRQPNRVMVA